MRHGFCQPQEYRDAVRIWTSIGLRNFLGKTLCYSCGQRL